MKPERWRHIEGIFEAALARAPEDRAAFVAEACGGDDELRRDVDSLLAEDVDDAFIEAPIQNAVRAIASPGEDARIGQRLGAYRITGLVGEGGMGAVYRGVRDDDQYRKEVAIKLVRRGMGSASLLRRFRHERQILASLEHPHIARLLDGGTTDDGLPYLVMQFIDGVPITTYCEQRTLPIPDRLTLFLQVCAAVEYAHQNLVVHRDLKPGNVLVTGDGTPKLLDFGIAKLLTTDTETDNAPKTVTSLHLMTPDYASPEQVRGLPVSTATDVYSLGAVLYEMLSGERAHRFTSHAPADIERAVCETDIERPSVAAQKTGGPSSRRRGLDRDLDSIVLMAMRKEPERRYRSVSQFAEDIRRYLDGRPIAARPDTLGYRTGKFLRRHTLAVASAAVVLLTLIGGIVISTYQAQRADRRFQQVRRLANTVLFDLSDQIGALPGSTQARETVAKTGLEYLDSLAAEAGGDTGLQIELAEGYYRLALVQGGFRVPGLEQFDAALASHHKALALGREILAREGPTTRVLSLMVKSHSNIGDILLERGDLAAATAEIDEALGLVTALEAQPDLTMDQMLDVIVLLHFNGDLQLRRGDRRAAEQHYRAALAWDHRVLERFPGPRAQHSLSIDLATLGDALAAGGDLEGALEQYRQAVAVRLENVEQNPDNVRYRRELSLLYAWMGHFTGHPHRISLGDLARAEEYYRMQLALSRELAALDPLNAQGVMDLSFACEHLADVLVERDPAQAIEHYREALAVLRPLVEQSPNELRYLRRQATQRRQLAVAIARHGDRLAGLRQIRDALEEVRALAGAHVSNQQIKADLHATLAASSGLLFDAGEREEATRQRRAATALAEEMSRLRPDDLQWQWWLADDYSALGRLRAASAEGLAAGREACDWHRKALAVWEAWPRHATSSVFDSTRRERAARAVADCQRGVN